MRQKSVVVAIVLSCALASARSAPDKSPDTPRHALYAALGERAGIERLATDFVARLKADRRIGAAFKDSNANHLAGQLRDQLCELAGGPCTYDGPSMKQVHAGMAIDKRQFNALVEVLQDAMDAQRLPFAVQNRLLARLAPMHRDIVESPTK
jgi:hemoglobin